MKTIIVRQTRIRCWDICDGLNGYALNSRKTERGAVALAKARNHGCAIMVWPMQHLRNIGGPTWLKTVKFDPTFGGSIESAQLPEV